MASGRLADYLGKGDAAERPVTLDLHPEAVGFYYAEDSGEWSAWDGTQWLEDIMAGGGGSVAAGDVSYDNATSGLAATDVQEAIDEVAGSVVAGTAPVVTLGGTSYTLDDLTNGAWHVFTNSSLVTITVMDDSDEPVAPNAEFGLDVTGASGLVIVADDEAVIAPPKGGTLTMEQNDFAVLKRRAADDYKLVGSTEDAP